MTATIFLANPASAGPGSREVLEDQDGDRNTPPTRVYAGADRYWTSLFIASRYYIAELESGRQSTTAIVASGESLIDAAAAAGLARSSNAPVLLTPSNSVFEPAAHLMEVARVTRVIIVGGTAAVSPQVEAAFRNIPGVEVVDRIGGRNRYETAALIAVEMQSNADYCGNRQRSAILVLGDASFADITVAGPMAYALGIPIVLYSATELLPLETEVLFEFLEITNVVLIGATALDVVERQISALGFNTVSIAGRNSVATSVSALNALKNCLGSGFDDQSVALINHSSVADGIAAAPRLGQGLRVAGKTTPVLLVDSNSLPAEVASYLSGTPRAIEITAIGGEAVVSSAVAAAAVRSANGGTTTTTTSSTTTTTTTTAPPRRETRVDEYFCTVDEDHYSTRFSRTVDYKGVDCSGVLHYEGPIQNRFGRQSESLTIECRLLFTNGVRTEYDSIERLSVSRLDRGETYFWEGTGRYSARLRIDDVPPLQIRSSHCRVTG